MLPNNRSDHLATLTLFANMGLMTYEKKEHGIVSAVMIKELLTYFALHSLADYSPLPTIRFLIIFHTPYNRLQKFSHPLNSTLVKNFRPLKFLVIFFAPLNFFEKYFAPLKKCSRWVPGRINVPPLTDWKF